MKPHSVPSKAAASKAAAPAVKQNAPAPAPAKVEAPKPKAPLPEAKAADASPPKAETPVATLKAPPPLEDSRRDRASRDIGRIVDSLVAIIRAELDTDRLQGSARNALTHTVERLIAAKSNL